MVNGIIMASGFGRRMGKNKLLLPFKGKSIIEHIIYEAKASKLDNIVLITREEVFIKLGSIDGVKIVINDNAHLGQSESIKLGILNSSNSKGFMFLTGDQPLLESKVINLLIDKFNNNEDKIIVPVCNGKRNSPVIFPGDLKEELLSIEGDNGGREVIKRHMDRVEYVEFDEGQRFTDIDTYDDYLRITTNEFDDRDGSCEK